MKEFFCFVWSSFGILVGVFCVGWFLGFGFVGLVLTLEPYKHALLNNLYIHWLLSVGLDRVLGNLSILSP